MGTFTFFFLHILYIFAKFYMDSVTGPAPRDVDVASFACFQCRRASCELTTQCEAVCSNVVIMYDIN